MTGIEAITKLGVKLYGGKFVINDNLIEQYKQVYNTFLIGAVKNVDIENIYLKGVGLIGAKGLSKTSLMRIMHILFKDTSMRFKWATSQRLILMMEDYKVSQIIEEYANCSCDLYIDDIGLNRNEERKKWGNSINLISEILNIRDEMFVEKGLRTHFSSNIPLEFDLEKIDAIPDANTKNSILRSDTLSSIYGERIVDRLKGSNNIIKFKGESLR